MKRLYAHMSCGAEVNNPGTAQISVVMMPTAIKARHKTVVILPGPLSVRLR